MKKILNVENLNSDDLRQLLKGVVNQCFDEHFLPEQKSQKESPPKLVNIHEIAKMLNKSVATIHSYKRLGWLPYKKIGRSLFFSPDEVLTAMRNFNNHIKI